MFGAATGISAPSYKKNPTQNHQPDGDAATVAGDVGPGFHTWPSGHILQDTDSQPLIADLKDDANDNISFFVQKAELYGSLTSLYTTKHPHCAVRVFLKKSNVSAQETLARLRRRANATQPTIKAAGAHVPGSGTGTTVSALRTMPGVFEVEIPVPQPLP